MNFQEAEKNRYDTHHIISQRRQNNKITAFEHQIVEGLDKISNLQSFDQDEQVLEEFNKVKDS